MSTRTPVSRFRSITSTESLVARYARLEGRKLATLLRAGRPGAALGSVAELATGRNPYYAYRLGDERYQTVVVGEHELVVDAEDAGISRTLLAYGVHEHRSTVAYERELEWLAETVDGPVRLLEVGANIGYFCTVADGVLGDRARIHAVEPIPSNVDVLEENLERNGVADRATVDRLAFGAADRTVEVALSTHSNQHRVREATTDADGDETRTISVDQTTGDRYLERRGLDPASINAVRFDVEGYESEVLDGLSTVLEAPGPTVVFLELHPLELDAETQRAIVSRFAETGFEVASAVRTDAAAGVDDARRWHGLDCGVETLGDLEQAMAASDHSIECIVRKT